MSGSWRPAKLWHKNLIAAGIVVAALGILALAGYLPAWSQYRATEDPAHTVPAGGQLTAYGQTWRLDSVRRLTEPSKERGNKLPSGTVLAVVTIIRSGPPSLEFCVGVITDGKLRWKAQGTSGFAAETADGATDNCARPGPLQLTFLLPENVVPTSVDLTDPRSEHILLRVTF